MMTVDEMRELVAYTEWATAKLLEALRLVPDAARRRRDDSAFGSLHGTFAHIVGAEWVWLERWNGRAPATPAAWVGEASFDGLVQHLDEIQRGRAAYLSALKPTDLAAPIAYRTFAGMEAANPIGDLIKHVVNHGSYHRGQLSMQLRQLGAKAPSTDYIAWLRETGRASAAPRA